MKCGVWRVQCEVWGVKSAVWSVECEVGSVECEESSEKWEVWSVDCEVWSAKCGVLRVLCEVKRGVRRVQCEVWSVKSAVRSAKCEVEIQMWHVRQDATFAEWTHARAWLAHGACKFYRWERPYISPRQLPPRLVRVLLVRHDLFTPPALFGPLAGIIFEGSLAGKLHFHIFNFQVWREVSHESFLCTSSAFRFWGKSCKLPFHIFHFQILREGSHESFAFTSSTFWFWGKARTKASFSHFQLSDVEGSLARKLRFHIFHFQVLREVLQESFVFTSRIFKFWGKSCRKASLAHLQLSVFEGSLARKLRFHIFHFEFLRDVWQESFAFTSSTSLLWKPRPKASFSCLASRLRA